MSQQCSQTIVDLFESGAYLNTEGVAVIYDDGIEKQIMTYGQLISAVQRVCSCKARLTNLRIWPIALRR